MKCKYWRISRCAKYGFNPVANCPTKNVDKMCNILPRQSKTIKVKAWAVLRLVQVDKNHDIWRTEIDQVNLTKNKKFKSIPCTVVYDRKHDRRTL